MDNKRGSSRTFHGLVGRAWTPSMREEVLAALYLIAGLEAWHAEIRWLAWCLFVKATNDTVCALVAALTEVLHERKANAAVSDPAVAGTLDRPCSTIGGTLCE
jgi:hypothetical protein